MSSIPSSSINSTADKDDAGVDGETAAAAKGETKGTAHGGKKAKLDGGWDPIHCPDWDKQTTAAWSVKRVQRDLQQLYKNPPHGIFAVPDEGDLSRIHVLIVGPMDTPYEGGFFYFLLRLPPDYPLRPPRARLMTTAGDTVRFNPNLYQNGKVCLSILGTWDGPGWAASLTLESVALSIQSLMSEKPYHNEPGYEHERRPGDSDRYNTIIQYETLRVAVCEMMEDQRTESKDLPDTLKAAMRGLFAEFVDTYVANCQKLVDRGLQGAAINDPFGCNRGIFDVNGVMKRLQELQVKYGISS